MSQENFWDTSDGESAATTTGEFDGGGGDIEPIPAKTQVLAAIDEVGWDSSEYGDPDEYIKARWTVLGPEEYKGRKVFQKIRVESDDSKKADKAKRMLAAIDANAGGKLAKAGERPDDISLTQNLCNKPMVLMLQIWKMENDDGQEMTGNWVSSVSPRGNKKVATASGMKAAPKTEPKTESAGDTEAFDDDVPW